MKYYLDCEFNGYRGELISLALVAEDGREMYLARPRYRVTPLEPWVAENVQPIINADGAKARIADLSVFPLLISEFLKGDKRPEVIADWPDDIRYFCEVIITGPGEMIDIPGLTCEVCRVDAYPTDLPGAVQHNALWDARALRRKLTGPRR